MENFTKIADALLGMCPPHHEVHQWLVQQVGPWKDLAGAIYDVGCFLKSQKKRSRVVCDENCLLCG